MARSFEESLQRVLDPEGLYWRHPDDDTDDPAREREVEIRLDVTPAGVAAARARMESDGWQLASQPDEADDPIQRLYFRKATGLSAEDKTRMLTLALHAARDGDGTFWSWIECVHLD